MLHFQIFQIDVRWELIALNPCHVSEGMTIHTFISQYDIFFHFIVLLLFTILLHYYTYFLVYLFKVLNIWITYLYFLIINIEF